MSISTVTAVNPIKSESAAVIISNNPADTVLSSQYESIPSSVPALEPLTGIIVEQQQQHQSQQSIPLDFPYSNSRFPCHSAYSLYQHSKSIPILSIGDPIIDSALSGGIRCNTITEISGEAGSGKTQLAMHYLLQCQLPIQYGGLDGESLYICTEAELRIDRLQQLIQGLIHKYSWLSSNNTAGAGGVDYNFCDSIKLVSINTVAGLLTYAKCQLENIIQTVNCRLIIIDSIAAPFRTGSDNNNSNNSNNSSNLSGRSEDLFQLMAQLKLINSKYSIPIIILNQVTDVFIPERYQQQQLNNNSNNNNNNSDSTTISNAELMLSSGLIAPHIRPYTVLTSNRLIVPSLGLTWANCITNRIILTRSNTSTNTDILRELTVVFSPYMESGKKAKFIIQSTGLKGIELYKSNQQQDADINNNNINNIPIIYNNIISNTTTNQFHSSNSSNNNNNSTIINSQFYTS